MTASSQLRPLADQPTSAIAYRASPFFAPEKPWSLWNMLRIGSGLFALTRSLHRMSIGLEQWTGKDADAGIVAETRTAFREAMDVVDAECTGLGLDASVKQAQRIRGMLEAAPDAELETFSAPVKELINRIEDELGGRAFFYMPMDKAKYYDDPHPLGDAVAKRFPALAEDADEAGKCFASGRYTACVFHLMRAMERLVQVFAEKLGLSERTIHFRLREWGRILGAAKRKIDALPQKTTRSKRRREAYSEAWAFLDRVREAWRNTTMHPKETYTEEEAKDIFAAVRAFATRLAKLI